MQCWRKVGELWFVVIHIHNVDHDLRGPAQLDILSVVYRPQLEQVLALLLTVEGMSSSQLPSLVINGECRCIIAIEYIPKEKDIANIFNN